MTISERALSDNAVGALWMSASMAAFTFNDALVKIVSGGLPLFQMIFLRGLVATALILLLALRNRAFAAPLARPEKRLIALRALSETAATMLFLSALMRMPLAGASAVLQAAPIALTLIAVLFLGERVG